MDKKKNIIGIAILCVATIICIAFGFYAKDVASVDETIKNITVSVVNGDDVKEFNITTNGDTLTDAVNELDLVQGEQGQYGLYIKTVNGYTADEEKEEWWCITKAGEPVFEGIDNIKIANGQKYEITLKKGY